LAVKRHTFFEVQKIWKKIWKLLCEVSLRIEHITAVTTTYSKLVMFEYYRIFDKTVIICYNMYCTETWVDIQIVTSDMVTCTTSYYYHRYSTAASISVFYCLLLTNRMSFHQSIADDRYLSDPHARIHRVLNQFQHWQRDWTRDQCMTAAQLRTGPLRCWQDIFTGSAAGTSPPVSTATVLTRWQNTWCYSAQLITRSGGTSGQEENSSQTLDTCGTSSNGSGR